MVDRGLAHVIEDLLGNDLPVAVEAYDGTRLGPPDAEAAIGLCARAGVSF